MRILAIETSHTAGSVAAMADGSLVASLPLSPGQGTAQSLAPGLKEVLREAGWRPQDVQLVAVTVGPGSFTGLRVGLATAKTFAYTVGGEVLGIDTLETIAAGVPSTASPVAVAVDAQRGDVVAATFAWNGGDWRPVEPQRLLKAKDWLAQLPSGTAVGGPVLRKLADGLPPHVVLLPEEFWLPNASAVARLANRDYAAGRRDDLWKLVPRYSRVSAAEEVHAKGRNR